MSEFSLNPKYKFTFSVVLLLPLGGGGFHVDSSGPAAPNPPANEASELQKFTSIAAGETHTCAITSDKEVACWGTNTYFQATLTHHRPKIRATLKMLDLI